MKLLGIDDDPVILEIMTEFIATMDGFEVEVETDPAMALARLADGAEFDCILLDIQMPGLDGIAACAQIRGMPAYARTPILMLTAMSEKRYIDRAFAAGATDYITKPFELAELRARLSLVSELVTERRLTQRAAAAFVVPGPDGEDLTGDMGIAAPFLVEDIEGLIPCFAFENYIQQLSRNALFGCSVFGISICKVQEQFEKMTPYEFKGLISDVAEALSTTLAEQQFLMTYAGNGTFLCVTERGWKPEMTPFLDKVTEVIELLDSFGPDGKPLDVKLAAGKVVRLVWRAGDATLGALQEAQQSAEEAAYQADHRGENLWLLGESA